MLRHRIWEYEAGKSARAWSVGASLEEKRWYPPTVPRWTDEMQRKFNRGTLDQSDFFKQKHLSTRDILNDLSRRRFSGAGGVSVPRGGSSPPPPRGDAALLAEKSRWEQALVERPDDVEACLKLGDVLFQMGDAVGALERFRSAERLDAARAEIASRLGMALAALGRTEESVRAFQRARERNPADVQVSLALGFALCEAGRHDAAGELFRSLPASAEPSLQAGAHLGMALVLQKQGDVAGSQREYRLAEEALPGLGPVMSHLDQTRVWPTPVVGRQEDSTHPALRDRVRRLKNRSPR
jgi:tetratricopeptide (TPR) repeat protein